MQSERIVNYFLMITSFIYDYSFPGCCWISLVYGGGSWEVTVKGNTARRLDGTINSSPVTSSTPILRLQHGCDHIYRIPGR